MYKNLGASNTDMAGYTGSLHLPWSIKFAWTPISEMVNTKRHCPVRVVPLVVAAYFALFDVADDAEPRAALRNAH